MGPSPVSLVARMNALGLLQISCISAAPGSQQSLAAKISGATDRGERGSSRLPE